MIKFRDYQEDIISKGADILCAHKFLYLAMEVRTGKTLTSLGILNEVQVNNVLFVTKKKAISSIQSDYDLLSPSFHFTVINYESLHKVNQLGWDAIVLDEAHGMGAFPKPSGRAKKVKELFKNSSPYVILLSGTPTPESYSQMYHQVYYINGNPFRMYKNFYQFAKDFVKVKKKKIGGMFINDYSKGSDQIIKEMERFTISHSQKESGFVVSTKEVVLEVDMPSKISKIINKLKKNLVVEGDREVILADTSVKLMTKIHQLCSGTIKFESGNSMVLSDYKAEFIKNKFKGKRIAIFYKFKQELEALKSVFGDRLVTELEDFDKGRSKKVIALQIYSGREGISLKRAEALVYYNIDFSATSYWQSRDRMTTKDRLKNDIYWIFSKGGIESDIYKAVQAKKDYTLRHFKRDLLS
jgi:superfamily II DNA or RNA helicase